MRRLAVLLLLCWIPSAASAGPPATGGLEALKIGEVLLVPNHGQEDQQAKFVVECGEVKVYFCANSVIFSDNGKTSTMEWPVPSYGTDLEGEQMMDARVHYYRGRDPSGWITDVPAYKRVRYSNIFPGIDLVFYSNGESLEHDWIVHPGGKVSDIAFRFSTPDMDIDSGGKLRLGSTGIMLQSPHAYSEDQPGRRLEVTTRMLLDSGKKIRFEVNSYDRSRDLVIDPVIQFSSPLHVGLPRDIKIDAANNMVIAGDTGTDAFVEKIRPNGQVLFFARLGGSNLDSGQRVALDDAGNIYLAGSTDSPNFPVTPHAYKRKCGTDGRCNQYHGEIFRDAFVSKFSAGGRLIYSTYLGGGGDDIAFDVAADAIGEAYVAMYTFGNGGTLAKLNSAGSRLLLSTKLDSLGQTTMWAVRLDVAGNIYLACDTLNSNLPVTNGFQAERRGYEDGYVAELSPDGARLLFSTYLGGTGADKAKALAIDSMGNVVVSGETYSNDFPLKNPIQPVRKGKQEIFITKFRTDGTGIVFSTYWGGSKNDFLAGVDVDPPGNVYLAGWTTSPNLRLKNALQGKLNKGGTAPYDDAFLLKLDPSGTQILYSTYFGGHKEDGANGIAAGKNGATYVIGSTGSADFTYVKPFTSSEFGDFVLKLNPSPHDH